jgi:hypothetical protein
MLSAMSAQPRTTRMAMAAASAPATKGAATRAAPTKARGSRDLGDSDRDRREHERADDVIRVGEGAGGAEQRPREQQHHADLQTSLPPLAYPSMKQPNTWK